LLAVIGKSSEILRTPSYVQFSTILTVVEFLVSGTAQTTKPSNIGTAMPLRCSQSLLDFITSSWKFQEQRPLTPTEGFLHNSGADIGICFKTYHGRLP
jgi:hypothetical protein